MAGIHEDLDVLSLTEATDDTGQGKVETNPIIRASLKRSTTKVVELMNPHVVLDQLVEKNVFGDYTRVKVRDIREAITTSEKNRAIHDSVSRDPTLYPVLKECLAATRQINLLDVLEEEERIVHAELIETGRGCVCTATDATGACELITSLKCNRDLPEFVSPKVRDIQRSLIHFYKDQCQCVPVYPLIPEVRENLQSLYVEPNMEIVDIRGKDLGLDSQSCRKTCKKDLQVTGYRDIFYKDNKPCRNVYVTGDAGIGKSAFCENMVLTWCRAHARTDDAELTEDEKLVAEFPLLFYISLRYALEDSDIYQMISSQLEVDNAKELLETERCLVVLDGLDEWVSLEHTKGTRFVTKGLPMRSLTGNFTIITTSRPWKLEQLRLKENEIDNQISIRELNQESLETLSERLLNVMNKVHNTEKRVSEFAQFMQKKKLGGNLKTPVLLSLMVCLWYYDAPFGDSECEIYSNMIDKQIELAVEQKELHAECYTNDQSRSLPGCFKTNEFCKKYSTLLLSLSKLAFAILFHENRESSLVFDHKDTEICGMSPLDMTLCLKMGLLTQNKVFANFVKRSKSISFIHKTHQEFLAAVHLATLDYSSAYDLLTSKSNRSLDKFLEMYKVLLFLNGMNGKLGDEILSHIRELADTDSRVIDYRLSCIGPCDKNYPLVSRVQSLIIDCENERLKNRLPASSQSLNDLVITDSNGLYHLMRYWKVLEPRCATSLSLQTLRRGPNKPDTPVLWNRVLDCGRNSDKLQKIYIFDSTSCLNVENIYTTVLETCSTLTCLVLCRVDISCLGEKLMTLLTLPRLLTLGLGDFLYLTHDQIDIVSEFLLQANYIQDLRLKKFRCVTHSDNSENCLVVLDASRNNALRKLFVAGRIDLMLIDTTNVVLLEARHIEVPGITKSLLECLRGSPKLEEIEITSDHQVDKTSLVNVLPELVALRQARLIEMDFTGMELRFPKSMAMLEFVKLHGGYISNSTLRRMLDDLPQQRVEIWIGSVNIIRDDSGEFVKDYIRKSDKFEITLDDPSWMYFHSVR